MMNTTKILQNAWNLTLTYRALWIFGVILALTTVSFGSAIWLRGDDEPSNPTLVNWEISPKDQAWIQENYGLDLPLRYTLKAEDLSIRLDDPSLSPLERTRLLRIAAAILTVIVVLGGMALVLRYTAEAALITMVNDRQHHNKKYRAREGWSLGFSMGALKLFLIDLVGYTMLLLLTPLLALPALLPVLIAISGSPAAISLGVVLMGSLMLGYVAALIVMWTAGTVILQLARRASRLEGLGVFASIWRGIDLLRARLRGVGLTWLVIIGLDLVYPIMAAPVAILLAAFGLAVGGLLALILGALLALVLAQPAAWTLAVIVGLVLLLLVVAVPLALMEGLREVFKSAAWTMTFSEAASSQKLEALPAPEPALPQAAAA